MSEPILTPEEVGLIEREYSRFYDLHGVHSYWALLLCMALRAAWAERDRARRWARAWKRAAKGQRDGRLALRYALDKYEAEVARLRARLAEYQRFAEFATPILREERAQFARLAEWEDQRRKEAQP